MKLTDGTRKKIIEMLKKAEAASFRHPTAEYRVYIDTDNEVDYEEWVAGDRGYYKFSGDYDRTYIHTFCSQHFSLLWDYWFASSYEFNDAFRNHFRVELETESESSLYDDGLATCRDKGISEDSYEEWIEQNFEDAIAYVQTDSREQYELILEEWEKEMDMAIGIGKGDQI